MGGQPDILNQGGRDGRPQAMACSPRTCRTHCRHDGRESLVLTAPSGSAMECSFGQKGQAGRLVSIKEAWTKCQVDIPRAQLSCQGHVMTTGFDGAPADVAGLVADIVSDQADEFQTVEVTSVKLPQLEERVGFHSLE